VQGTQEGALHLSLTSKDMLEDAKNFPDLANQIFIIVDGNMITG